MNLEIELASRIYGVLSLKHCVVASETQSTVVPAKLFYSINQDCDWYRRLLGSLTYQVASLGTNLFRVVTESQAGRADIRRGTSPFLFEFCEYPPAASESP